MDKALPSGGRDCGFESRLGLFFQMRNKKHAKKTVKLCGDRSGFSEKKTKTNVHVTKDLENTKKMGTMGIEPMTNGLLDQRSTD